MRHGPPDGRQQPANVVNHHNATADLRTSAGCPRARVCVRTCVRVCACDEIKCIRAA